MKKYAVQGTEKTGARVIDIATLKPVSEVMTRSEAQKLRDKLNAQEAAYAGGFNKRLK